MHVDNTNCNSGNYPYLVGIEVMDFYWILTEKDGTVTYIRPEDVPRVKALWDNDRTLHTSNRSIPTGQIKSFAKSDRRYTDQKLVEDASRAFNEPLYDGEANIVCRWVCKPVTQQHYRQHFAAIPSYRMLREEDGMILVAFRQPIHQIDEDKVRLCREDEILKLTGV